MKTLKIIFLLLFISCSLQLFGQNPMVGTWERKDGNIRAIKILTPTHWIFFADTLQGDKKQFYMAQGGSYTLQGNKYIEYIDLAATWDKPKKIKTDFTVRVEGDKLYQTGPITFEDGTVFLIDEVWQKVETGKGNPRNPGLGAWNQLSTSFARADGTRKSFKTGEQTAFEVITPTHWMRLVRTGDKFEEAFGGTYTMQGNTLFMNLDFASFPIDEHNKIQIKQKIAGNKRYLDGKIIQPDGQTWMSFEAALQRLNK